MKELDADSGGLYDKKGKIYQERDCCQFLALKNYDYSPEIMLKELLREVPDQIIQYFVDLKNIEPNDKLEDDALAKVGAQQDGGYKSKLLNQLKEELINAVPKLTDEAAETWLKDTKCPVKDIKLMKEYINSENYTNYLFDLNDRNHAANILNSWKPNKNKNKRDKRRGRK